MSEFLTTVPGTQVELRADGVHFTDPDGTGRTVPSPEVTEDGQTPGQIACEAWIVSHQQHAGCHVVGWDDLSADDRADWETAAAAVIMGVDI